MKRASFTAFAMASTVALTMAASLACQSTQVEEEVQISGESKKEMEEIRKLYSPVSCFRAGFLIEGVLPGQGSQAANGSVRVDNTNRRMRFIFTDTILGITLSQVTISGGQVFITNPRENGATVPLERFEVRGLGNNSIRLPFRLFQDLVYARLPDEVLSNQAKVDGQEKIMNVQLETPSESSTYRFESRRLRHLTYLRKGAGDRVEVDLTGKYRDSIFPQSIVMQSFREAAQLDRLVLTFNELNLEARCTDVYFPMH